MDKIPVDERAICTAKVFDGDILAVKGKGAMPAAHQLVVETDVGSLAASENYGSFFERDLSEIALRVQDYLVWMNDHRVEPDDVVVVDDCFIFHNNPSR